MKRFFGYLARIVGSALTIVLVVVLLPYASRLAQRLLPDESGAAIRATTVLSSKLESSARLETLTVQEDGVIHYEIQALLVGKVAEVDIQYEYSASFGIDLKKVGMQLNGRIITFLLPEPEVLNDRLTPTDTYRDDFWYTGFSDEDYQHLLDAERLARQSAYLGGEHEQTLWDATVTAFEETIAAWLGELGQGLSFQYEKVPADTTGQSE